MINASHDCIQVFKICQNLQMCPKKLNGGDRVNRSPPLEGVLFLVGEVEPSTVSAPIHPQECIWALHHADLRFKFRIFAVAVAVLLLSSVRAVNLPVCWSDCLPSLRPSTLGHQPTSSRCRRGLSLYYITLLNNCLLYRRSNRHT